MPGRTRTHAREETEAGVDQQQAVEKEELLVEVLVDQLKLTQMVDQVVVHQVIMP